MFTRNEARILDWLRQHDECGLVELAANCSMARSSAHTALANLLSMGVVQNIRPSGRGKYRIADRDAIERAAQRLIDEFRTAVSVETSRRVRPRLVFTDCYVLPDEYLETLGGYYEITVAPDLGALRNAAKFEERTRAAEVVVRFDSAPITRDFLQARPALKALVFPTVFPRNVDVQACKDFGVIVKHADPVTQKYFAATHVEFAVHATFTLLNPLRPIEDPAEYHHHRNLGNELFGKNVGLVAGTTNIRSLVEIFQAFGCTVRAASTAPTPPMASEFGLVSFRDVTELWDWADVLISLDGARPNLNQLLRRKVCPDYVINLSSSAELDIYEALNAIASGSIAGLALDHAPYVWNDALSDSEAREALARLGSFPNVLLTPEMAIHSRESNERSFAHTFDMLMALRTEL
jgi:phosphoglycerate dehydrogenase-like enzyme/predicted transcriptional regulator